MIKVTDANQWREYYKKKYPEYKRNRDMAFIVRYLNSPSGRRDASLIRKVYAGKYPSSGMINLLIKDSFWKDVENSNLSEYEKRMLYNFAIKYLTRYDEVRDELPRKDIMNISREIIEEREREKYDSIPPMELLKRKKKSAKPKSKRKLVKKCRCK